MSPHIPILYVLVMVMIIGYSIALASITQDQIQVDSTQTTPDEIAVFSATSQRLTGSKVVLPSVTPPPDLGTRLTVQSISTDGVIQTSWSASSTNPIESNIVTVQKNSLFSTIQSALDYVTGQTRSATSVWVVQILPGLYTESNLVVPEYVAVQGFNQAAEVIITSDMPASGYIFKMSDNSTLESMTLASSYAGSELFSGVYCDSAPTSARVFNMSFTNLPIGVVVQNSGPTDVVFYIQNCIFNGCTTHGIELGRNLGIRTIQIFSRFNTLIFQGNFTSAYHIHGQNTTLNINTANARLVGAKPAQDGYFMYASDGSTIRVSGLTVYDFNIGLYVNNDTGTPSVQVLNANFIGCTQDVQIENGTCTGIITGVMDRARVSVPDGVAVMYADPNGLGTTLTGHLYQGTTNTNSTNITSMIQQAQPLGLLTGGTLSMSGSTLSVTAGAGYVQVSDAILYVEWDAQSYGTAMTAYSQVYAYINSLGALQIGSSIPDSFANIILGIVNTDGSANLYYIQEVPRSINHIPSGLVNMLDETMGPVFATGGCTVTNPSALNLAITAGSYYFGNLKFTYTGQSSPAAFDTYYYTGSGGMNGWTITTAQTSVPIQYNNTVAGTLVAITDQHYTKHTLYISGSGTRTFLVYGSELFASSADAINGAIPAPPAFFVANTVSIASIVVFRNGSSYTIDSIQQIFPTLSFVSGQVASSSNHSTLLNLGADTHLQYLPVNGSRTMLGTLDMATNPIQNITTAGLLGSTSGSTLTVQADAKTGTWTLSLPTSAGTVGQVLQTNGTGNGTSWVTTSILKQLAANQTSTSSTLVDVPGFGSISLAANTTYYFVCKGIVQTDAGNTGYLISTNASPAATVNYMYTYWTSNTNSVVENVTTLGGGTFPTTSAANGGYTVLEGSITTTLATTFAVQYAVEAGAGHYVTMKPGAFVYISRIG